jgi:hypothetical protein
MRSLATCILLAAAVGASTGGGTTVSAATQQQSGCDGTVHMVAVAADASPSEQAAAELLASFMGRLAAGGAATAPPLKIVTPAVATGQPHLAVGSAAAAAAGLPPAALTSLNSSEGFVLTSNRTAAIRAACAVVLAGAPNSTGLGPVYAAQELLRLLGVRFLAWDETLLPTDMPTLPDAGVDMTFEPRFEYRDVDGWAALSDPQQAQYFHLNGVAQAREAAVAVRADAERAAPPATATKHKSPYATPPGFVHTSYRILYEAGPYPNNPNCSSSWECPPAELFRTHNEW